MPRRRIPNVLFPAGPTAADRGATPQTRNADPGADAAARSRPSPSAARSRSNCGRPAARTARLPDSSALTCTRRTRTSRPNSPRSVRQTVEQAAELRDLELQRFDEMTAGLWPQVQEGSPPAVTAAVRVSERRSRLLGLDEPTATRTEISGSLSVDAEARIKARSRGAAGWLSFEELRALGAKSDKLFADARALAKARSTQMTG